MDTIQTAVGIGHTLIALLIIVLVLLQRGKGADAGAAFGAGVSGTVFGARGSGSFFSRATAVCATAFFATSLTLAYLSSQKSVAPSSLVEDVSVVEEAAAPESDMPPMKSEDDLADEATDMPVLEDGPDQDEPAAEESTSDSASQ